MAHKKILFSDIVSAFEDAGMEPRKYSGRGMMGAECLGVPCSNPMTAVLEAIECFANGVNGDAREVADQITEFVRMFKNPSTDNLGHDRVIYWSHIKWEEREDEDPETNREDLDDE